MNIVRAILLVALAMVSDGCRSTHSNRDEFSAGELECLKNAVNSHGHVILVCVYEDHLQRIPPPSYHRLDSKATVVCSYKGTWQVSERVTFRQWYEDIPGDSRVGHLMYAFLKVHTQDLITLEPSEAGIPYNPKVERQLQFILSGGKKR